MGNNTGLDEKTSYLMKKVVPQLVQEHMFLDGQPIILDGEWQTNLLGSTNLFEVWVKARQIGFSWGDALRSLWRAMLFPDASYNKVFVSINREEARQKIRYIDQFMQSLPASKRVKAITDNKMEIEFVNGNRIQSFPSNPVRGLTKVDLSLDEFAHIREARTIYEGSTASTIRGSYGVTIGSTPFGRGLFKDIARGAGKAGEFKHFVVNEVPWWRSSALCVDPLEATIWGPGMRTIERVDMWGTNRLKQEFESLPLESFQTEYECCFLDSGNSVLTEDMIANCMDPDHETAVLDIDCGENIGIQVEEVLMEKIKTVLATQPCQPLFLGFDVGREINSTEIMVMGMDRDKKRLVSLMYITLRKAPFPLQKLVLRMLIKMLGIKKAVLDAQGIGTQLAEEAQLEFSTIVHPMVFGINSKEEMVSSIIKAFEERYVKMTPTKRLWSQLLSVKKVTSETGRILYHAALAKEEKEYRAHADMFWALAMCIWGAITFTRGHIPITRRSPILSAYSYGGPGHYIAGKRNYIQSVPKLGISRRLR